MRLHRQEGGQMGRAFGAQLFRYFAAEAAVAQQHVHGGMAEGRHHAVVLPEVQLALRPGGGVERIGVLHKGGVGRGLE